MRLGARELLFLCVMIGLLACTYFMVFKKSDERRRMMLSDIEQKEKALHDLTAATVGVEDLGGDALRQHVDRGRQGVWHGVAVDVDEAGSDKQPARVDLGRRSRRG